MAENIQKLIEEIKSRQKAHLERVHKAQWGTSEYYFNMGRDQECEVFLRKLTEIVNKIPVAPVVMTRQNLEALVKGSSPSIELFENVLVKKAGHSYSDQYGKTSWDSLDKLSENELFRLYRICQSRWV